MAGFIKFDGIAGESADANHKEWSDLVSFTQVLSRPGGSRTGTTRNLGDVNFEDIHVVKELDKSSPKLAESVGKGQHFPTVEIELTKSVGAGNRTAFYKYTLTKVFVTSYNISGTGSQDENPVEDITLNYEEIQVTYTPVGTDGKPGGAVEYQFKVAEGTP